MVGVKNVKEIINKYNELVDQKSDFKYVINKIKEEGVSGEPLKLLENKVIEIEEKIQELLDLDVQVLTSLKNDNPLNPKK